MNLTETLTLDIEPGARGAVITDTDHHRHVRIPATHAAGMVQGLQQFLDMTAPVASSSGWCEYFVRIRDNVPGAPDGLQIEVAHAGDLSYVDFLAPSTVYLLRRAVDPLIPYLLSMAEVEQVDAGLQPWTDAAHSIWDDLRAGAAAVAGANTMSGPGDWRCDRCGCTDLDCSGCIARTGHPCYWVSPVLCSACVVAPKEATHAQ